MSEAAVVQQVRATLSNGPVRLFRNNVGEGWQGVTINKTAETITLKNYRRVNFGLCEGSHDLIGLKSIVITPDMVGSRLAVFVSLEGKSRTGSLSDEQHSFLAMVLNAGGIAGVFRSLEDAKEILK